MKKNLTKLYDYLTNNGYVKDAERIADIIKEYDEKNELSDISKRKLRAMCNLKYLGNLYIKDFNTPYEWWNFLDSIVLGME